jgi:protein-S-isoprenylcysteine O-methyltransferase Ste14
MDQQIAFRAILLIVIVGYIVPRTYYRRKARRGSRPDESALQNVTESKLRLALLGLSGLSADLLSVVWVINPAWLSWSSLPLPDWLRWVGAPLGAVAMWLDYLSLRTLDTNYTETLKTKKNHRLVDRGIYGRVRHPMYASFFALLAAYFLITANWLIGALGLIYSLLIVGRVAYEEQMMLATFGEEYVRYRQRTGRFVPRLSQTAERQ